MSSTSVKPEAENQVNQYPDPPMVKGLPLIGSMFALWRNPLDFLRRTHEQYGDVYSVKLGRHKAVVLAGVEGNRFVAEEGKNLFSSSQFWRDTLVEMDCPHAFIGVDGPPHQFQRALMKPMFARSAFTHKIPELSQIFHDAFAAHNKGKTFVAPFMRHLLSKQIGGSLQNYQPSTDEVEALMKYQVTVMNVCSIKKWPRWLLKLPYYRACKAKVRILAEKIIRSERAKDAPPRYLDVLIEEGQKKKPQWFTPGDIRNHAIISFLAGIDTMGAAMSFMLLTLFRYPEVRELLQKEVDDLFDQGEPDIDAIERMQNVKNFVREVLRLYPPAFALNRTATSSFIFQGYRIRRGQNIILFTTSSHTDPAYFKDPYRFDLTRYDEPRLEHRAAGAYGVFGKGPHTCIGAGLANVLLPLNLALILRHATIAPACDLSKIGMNFSNPVAMLNKRFSIFLLPARIKQKHAK